MRKILMMAITVVMLVVAANFVSPLITDFLYRDVEQFTDEYDLAFDILENLENDVYETKIKETTQINSKLVFNILESIYPYSFSAEILKGESGITKFDIIVNEKEQQDKALILADTLAQSLVDDSMSDIQMLEEFHNYIVLNTVYDEKTADTKDVADSKSFWAYGALFDGSAVCAGYSRALTMMAQSVGIDLIYVTSEAMNHGWNALRLDGETYFIDATFDDPIPDRPGRVSMKFFMVDSEQLEKTHSWDKNFCEKTLDKLEEMS